MIKNETTDEGENETVKGAKGILIILSDHIYVYSALTFPLNDVVFRGYFHAFHGLCKLICIVFQ